MQYDLLYNMYIEQKLSTRKIAVLCGVSQPTVINYMKRYEIPRRSLHESMIGLGKGKIISKEHKQCISKARTGLVFSEEIRRKMSVARKRYMREHGHRLQGTIRSEKTKRLISAARQGVSPVEWNGFVSFEPYCFKFNFELKEQIRNRDNRTCQLCGKSEIENGRRLSVHHVDGDKMQGCNDKSWHLISLCLACNSKKDTLEKEFVIVANSNIRRK